MAMRRTSRAALLETLGVWFHNGPDRDRARRATPRLRERLLELHRDDLAWIAEVLRATPSFLGRWLIHELDAMPRWFDGRVCLLDNAAHAMSPSAAQGAALAMEDAVVLAQCRYARYASVAPFCSSVT